MATPSQNAAQDLANAVARRSEILAELAAGGWGPNVSEQGRGIDLVGYRRSLQDELKTLNEMIPTLGGPWEISEYR